MEPRPARTRGFLYLQPQIHPNEPHVIPGSRSRRTIGRGTSTHGQQPGFLAKRSDALSCWCRTSRLAVRRAPLEVGATERGLGTEVLERGARVVQRLWEMNLGGRRGLRRQARRIRVG